jgi:hypothetical protein
MMNSNQTMNQQIQNNKFQTYSDIDVGYNSSGGLTPPHNSNYDFGFIPGSPVSSSGSCNKTVSSDNDNSTSLSLHDVALEAELAMLQHAYSSPEADQRSAGTPSTIAPSDSASNFDLHFQQQQLQQQQHLQHSHQQQKQWNIMEQHMAWRNTLATANLMNLQSQVMAHGQETQTQAALGLLYDYYQHQQPTVRKQPHFHQQQPQQQQQHTPVVKSTPKSVVSVKSEPLDTFDVAKTEKKESLTVMTPLDIKKETTANSGLPETYKGEYFEYSMEAPRSLKQKEGEPTMSYINKAQFYSVNLREVGNAPWAHKSTKVKSVVSVIFGDGKPEDEQLRHWRYWHGRQHTAKQRVIDIADYKESSMVTDIHEFAHNSISFQWDVQDAAKIFISVNCLSTDFSAQKGIKGLPLLLQIDTYTDMRRNAKPVHRAITQIKVFCDKGAERKIRDEERKAIRKKNGKNTQNTHFIPNMINNPINNQSNQFLKMMHGSKRHEMVHFKASADLGTPVTYFIPELSCRTEADYLAAGEVPPLDNSAEHFRKRPMETEETVPLKVFYRNH